jgi:trans-aconitate methyltransferase
MWKMDSAHKEVLKRLFADFDKNHVYKILDAGSGRTSLSFLTKRFPKSNVEAMIYPGDERKKKGIVESVRAKNYFLNEVDIRAFKQTKQFDIVLAHLLLGEATKFKNKFADILRALFKIKTKYLVIIDIANDVEVDFPAILRSIKRNGTLWKIFYHDIYIGFLIKR